MKMSRTVSSFSLVAGIIAAIAVFTATGCKRERVFTIGIVNVQPGLGSVVKGFKAGLAEMGYGKDKKVVYLDQGTLEIGRADAVLKDLAARKPDLIFVLSTPVARKARAAVENTGVPVVFAPVLYPVESGLVGSLTRPGGNLTGVQVGGSTEKALEWLKLIAPRTKRILVPFYPGEETVRQGLNDLRRAAAKIDIALAAVEVRTLAELRASLAVLPGKPDAIWLLNSPLLPLSAPVFVEAAIRHKLPLASATSEYRSGVMLTYGPDQFRIGRQASRMAHKILQGMPPADIPVETPDFYLNINLRTARAVGIEIPDALLKQASNIVR